MQNPPKSQRLTTDPWGIDSGYDDTESQWHDTPADTREAILAAMGVEDASTKPEGQDAVRFVRPGEKTAWPERGWLHLDDGTQLPVQGSLPPDLPLGYHEFQPADRANRVRVIVPPPCCVLPDSRLWGWAAQLYASRSQESWGMGDLGDLRRLARWSASLGADVVMINPLHAATPLLPQESSPYYPSSRRYRNPLYLRVEDVPGANSLGDKLEKLAEAGRALNAKRRIDRDAVFRLKQEGLQAIWEHFPGDPAFERYCREHGSPLEEFAIFCALAERFGGDWRAWPEMYHNPRRPQVRKFAEEHSREIDYHRWLQWLVDCQLAGAAAALPIVQDLSIGFAPGGADAWAWQDVLALGCDVGAPPDMFNMLGQNWGVPPLVPHKLRAAGYEPFIQTLRSLLTHSGGLRIDHVMGLFRLYWIPRGFGAQQGSYVRYRADELLAIVALESHRAGAFIVGEDLGNVEPEVRRKLLAHKILSSRILWLEEKLPRDYPELAMVAATTHDLPTVAGLWTGADKAAQLAADARPNEAMAKLRRTFGRMIDRPDDTPVDAVIEETYRLLAQAPSQIILATLEDALAVEERPNMPGTTTQWPNWSLGLPGGLEALEASPLPRKIAGKLKEGVLRT